MDYIYRNGDHYKRRDLIIFGMYNTLIWLMDEEDAESYCMELNDGFYEPLTYGEMCSIMSKINKARYRIPNEKFFKLIKATPEEIAWYNKANKKEERKKATKAKREKRNEAVLELYNNGMKITDISEKLGISRPTIYKIINA